MLPASSTIQSIGLFKNGLAVVRRNVAVPGPGVYRIEDVPAPMHGTFFIESAATVTATNAGTSTAPYGVCPHPYLLAGPAILDEWMLEVPASEFLEVTPDRLLPLAVRTVDGHPFEFRTAKTIGTTEIDHAFTGLGFDGGGRARLLVRDPGGTGVGMEWDTASKWLQIHTADKQPPAPSRLGLAVEPMSCPPDAFNSGKDLIHLEPGGSHAAAWSIFAL